VSQEYKRSCDVPAGIGKDVPEEEEYHRLDKEREHGRWHCCRRAETCLLVCLIICGARPFLF
jgi:hypothetical protein